MDPRREATERLGGRYEARVLEPSPPAVAVPPWFADDPVARGEPAPGRTVVSPVATGDVRWVELAADDPSLADFCRERWLGPYRRLGPLPPGFVAGRDALHQVAASILSPVREAATGKIGLRYTRGGFGTPFFGADEQLRVEGVERVHVRAGVELSRDPLGVDPASAAALADWFGFAASVLEELRSEADTRDEPSRVQLWPEHFDMAVELGAEAAGARATYGLSPGDEAHPEPYVYVAPWTARPSGALWNATAFAGAELPYARLLAAADQRAAALAFLRERRAALSG